MRSRHVISLLLALILGMAALPPPASAQDPIIDGELLPFEPVQVAMRAWYGGALPADADAIGWYAFVTVSVLEFRSGEGATGYFDLEAGRIEDDGFLTLLDLELDAERSVSFRSPIGSDVVTGPGEILRAIVQEGEVVVIVTVMVFSGDDHPVDPELFAMQEEIVPGIVETVMTTDPGDEPPVEQEDGWDGGIWDRFPSREPHPFPDAVLHDVTDIYQVAEDVEASPAAQVPGRSR